MAIDRTIKSSRLLQSRRYTQASLSDAQEAFTSVLDINSREVYAQASLIPTSSLPFSGSSQSGSIYSVGGQNILRYWFQHPLTPSNVVSGSVVDAWFFIDPSGSAVTPQIIQTGQQNNFVSNKYASPSLTNADAQDNPPGYNIVVLIDNVKQNPASYQFDYKNGVLQFVTAAPLPTAVVRVTAYQYVGQTVDTALTNLSASISGVSGSLSNLSSDKIATGAVTASVATGSNTFTITNGGTSLFKIKNNGAIEHGPSVLAEGVYSYAAGDSTKAIGDYSHAEGNSTYAGFKGYNSVDIGSTTPGDIYLNAGYGDVSSQFSSGYIVLDDTNYNQAYLTTKLEIANVQFDGTNTIITLVNTSITGTGAIIGVFNNPTPTGADQIAGNTSHAEGFNTQALGNYSHAEGDTTKAIGSYSHAEGNGTQATGYASHAEGTSTQALGDYSHAEGESTIASGYASHAEGLNTQAIGNYSHAEGSDTQALGNYSHAEGENTTASGYASHAEGVGTIASGSGQTVMGKYNTQNNDTSLVIIGNGIDDSTRSDLVLFNSTDVAFNVPVASVNVDSNAFTIISASSTLLNVANSGLVTVSNLTVNDNLVVNGTASFINTENLSVKDRFILINSGSSTLADSGWVTQYNAAGSGSAFYLDADTTGTYGRFAVAFDVVGNESIVTANEYVVTARQASGAPPATPTWGGATNGFGNIYVNSDNGDIFIYS